MAFLFKSKKGSSSALPAASRDIRSSEGPSSGNSSSQIPTLNGIHQQQNSGSSNNTSKPGSPTPNQQSSISSLNHVAEKRGTPDASGEKGGFLSREREREESSRGESRVQPSPEQKSLVGGGRERGVDTHQNRMTLQQQPRQPPQDAASPYPWSQRKLAFTVSHTNPFPRYGAAVNSAASKDGAVYLMGGLINGSTVKGDLWMVETGPQGSQGSMSCYPVATTSEGPGPRVGHASLLVGNAFIVFGGDTKMDEGDMLDDTLYLLNTSTKQWSRALPAGPRPPGRYGHTLNILGSRLYIFGGQVEGYFFNDLVAFDLNALQASSNRWEILIQNTIDGGPPHGQIPPARTNHSMVAWGDKLYLFGGTDGVNWFNDVWSYSPHTNSWTMLECIGYIPSAREGHAAALVGDVMYIFGGRTEEGTDLGDLAAFRISSRRWYTFQNMGPSPSPRSGHSMTTVGKSIVVLAGEPSSAPRDVVELGMAYFLDTSKIRYPADSASNTPANERIQGTRRPSGEKSGLPVVGQGKAMPQQQSQRPQQPQQPQELMSTERAPSAAGENRVRSPSESNGTSKLPRPGQQQQQQQQAIPASSGPPPAYLPPQPKPNGVPSSRQPTRPSGADRALSPTSDSERAQRFESNNGFAAAAASRGIGEPNSARASPALERQNQGSRLGQTSAAGYSNDGSRSVDESGTTSPDPYSQRRTKPETYTPTQDLSEQALERKNSRASSRTPQQGLSRENTGNLGNMNALEEEEAPREMVGEEQVQQPPQASQIEKARALAQNSSRLDDRSELPQDSGLGSSPSLSQHADSLAKELEASKAQTAWYASELALAKKSGYQSKGSATAETAPVDDRTKEVFGNEARPMVEAVLKMRAEMGRLQDALDRQATESARVLEQREREKERAVGEAVFWRSRNRGAARGEGEEDRSGDMGKRLAGVLAQQEELQLRVRGLEEEVERERKGRVFAEESVEVGEKRVKELEAERQTRGGELDGLREELHELEKAKRELEAGHAEVRGQHEMLRVERDELHGAHEAAKVEMGNHGSILENLRAALGASEGKTRMFEQRLEEERGEREGLETKLRQLKNEHEERTGELESTSRRLREAEELGEKHAEEARTHRSAVLAGLGKISERGPDAALANDERVSILQRQIASAETLVRTNQSAADAASEKLRRAEERIAGLEAYQEQASREGLQIRKQLQSALNSSHSLSTEKSELEQRLQQQQLETNAISVQHGALKDILAERGVNASEVRKSRALDSPSSTNRFSTPDLHRVKELESQLEASLKSHDDMKAQFEAAGERDERLKRDYEEKLTALDSDHQAAVKYLRGTEKMLSKMKQELQRVKNENGDLRKKIEKSARNSPEDWESERNNLRKNLEDSQSELKTSVADLEARLSGLTQQLQGAEQDATLARQQHATSQADLSTLQATHSQFRTDLQRLQTENADLEERARDAENKVRLLLDQVENSVDNYRRQSRLPVPSHAADDDTKDEAQTPTGGSHLTNGFGHARNFSGASSSIVGGGGRGHSRNYSAGGDSAYSGHTRTSSDGQSISTNDLTGHNGVGGPDGRNSLALDSLASELDALRSHWETQSKNHRLSERFDFERSAGTGTGSVAERAGLPDFGAGVGNSNSNSNSDANGSGVGTTGLVKAGTGQGVRQSGFGEVADWRSRLDVEEDDESSRPGTAEGPGPGTKTAAVGAGEAASSAGKV